MTLTAANITLSYGSRNVLHSTGFGALEPGRLTALIGPNASGKSTLFKTISGLIKPRTGMVTLGGTDLSTLTTRERLRRICFMPQFFAANAALTVFDVVLMAHKQLQGWTVSPGDVAAVADALEAAGVAHLSEAYISELSGGQSQMISVTQALIRKADVYLFDEPTSALDLKHQISVLTRIRDTMRARRAIGIVALHDLNLAARFADHLLLMRKGRICAEGALGAVLRRNEIAETYGVTIEITEGPRSDLVVHAYPKVA